MIFGTVSVKSFSKFMSHLESLSLTVIDFNTCKVRPVWDWDWDMSGGLFQLWTGCYYDRGTVN